MTKLFARLFSTNGFLVASFWAVFSLLILMPIFWLISVALQDQSTVLNLGHNGYGFLPNRETVTIRNVKEFFDANTFLSAAWFSFRWFAPTSIIVVAVALGTVFRKFYRSHLIRTEKLFLFFLLSLFFNPPFAILNAVQSTNMASVFPNLTLCFFEGATAYAFAMVLLISIIRPEGQVYEQHLLNYRDPWLAFWHGVVCPIWPTLIAVVLIVFSLMWNETGLSSFLTTNQADKPFAVVLQRAVGQYKIEFGSFAVGAVLTIVVSCLALFPIVVFPVENLVTKRRRLKDKKDLQHGRA